jgi:hypothetical protein
MSLSRRHLPLVVALTVSGCGVVADVRDDVAVQTAPLTTDTSAAFFAMGRSRGFQPLASHGAITPAPRVASAVFRRVGEGDWAVDFLGFGQLAFVAPNPRRSPRARGA